MATISIRCEIREGDEVRTLKVTGRMAWALQELVKAGAGGLTTLTRPAPRWSDYIFKLRRAGLAIETETEVHGGPFSGHHGRYRLLSNVRIVEVTDAESEAA